MIAIDDLRVVATIAETSSLSAAGRQLELAPATVSHKLGKIEHWLRVRLFQRDTRKLTLTPEGEAFYQHLLPILAALKDAESAVTQRNTKPHGRLKITASPWLVSRFLIPSLDAFISRYPEIELALDTSDRMVDIIDGGFDLALRVGRLKDSNLIATRLADNRRVLCAAPAYLEKYGVPRRPDDLRQHRCLALPWQQTWVFKQAGKKAGVALKIRPAVTLTSADALRAAVITGLGIASKSLLDISAELRAGQLCTVLDEHLADAPAPVYVVYPSRQIQPLKVKVFLAFLRGVFQQEF